MTNNATNDRLLLDCLTCRHRFLIRRSGKWLAQLCPKCGHFVAPCEREVPPVRWLAGPAVKAPPSDDELDLIKQIQAAFGPPADPQLPAVPVDLDDAEPVVLAHQPQSIRRQLLLPFSDPPEAFAGPST